MIRMLNGGRLVEEPFHSKSDFLELKGTWALGMAPGLGWSK